MEVLVVMVIVVVIVIVIPSKRSKLLILSLILEFDNNTQDTTKQNKHKILQNATNHKHKQQNAKHNKTNTTNKT